MQIIRSVYQAQQKFSQNYDMNDNANDDANDNENDTNVKLKSESTNSDHIHHQSSYSTIHPEDIIDDIHIDHITTPTTTINDTHNNHNDDNYISNLTDNNQITPISNNIEQTKNIIDTLAPNKHLSNLSQLTVNDTTISSSDNDLLLEDPSSFEEGSNINSYDISNLIPSNNPILTLNDMDPQIKEIELDTDINTPDNENKIKNNNEMNNLVSVQDNQLIINDLCIDLNFDFSIDSSDYSNSSSNSNSIPMINQLNISTPNDSTHFKLNNNIPKSNSNSSTSYSNSYSNSCLNTNSSKLLCNSDISINHLKRSFTRLKQTSELLNTEKVYICSLKILEEVYLNNFMSDTKTPIYFDIFKDCVSKLLENHQKFYDNLNLIYNEWYNKSISFVKNDLNLNDSNLSSPNFEKFNYVSNERDYLESVINLILNDSINVEVYSIYCSLFQRILKFSNNKGIENYKRNSIIILNDYLVDHKNLEADYFIDKHLDRRFISVVQMPTNRIVRYKLILKSLLKNIEFDEHDKLKLKFYSKVLENINLKIDEINSYVGNEDLKLQKLEKFKKLIDNKNNKLYLTDNLFLENLENLQLSSSFELIYPIKSKNCLIHSDYVCGFLFKSHLILAKPSHIISNSLDIKFIIPLLSITNNFETNSNHNLVSNYNEKINLKFEDNFKIYEICFIFPDEKEKLLWEGQLKVNCEKFNNLNNMKNKELNYIDNKFLFSDIQSKILSIDLSSEIEKFNVTSNIPSTINPVIKNKNNEIIKNDNIYNFEIDNFLTHSNTHINNKNNNSNIILRSDSTNSLASNCSIDTDTHSIKTKNSLINLNRLSNKTPIIKITLQDRVYSQTCIKSVWSQQFQIYTLNSSISRSLSNLFHSKMSLLSLSNHNDSNNNILNDNNDINDNENDNSNSKLLNSNFIPPSPSFVFNGGSLGSPIKLRNAKSMKTLRDVVGRNSISSPRNHSFLPPTPTINTNMNENIYDIKFETPNNTKNNSNNTSGNTSSNYHSSYNSSHHNVRKSGSLRSLSSFISSGVNSSGKSINSNNINHQNSHNCHNNNNHHHNHHQYHNDVNNNIIPESSSMVSLSECESNHSENKKNNRVSKFWKNLTVRKDKD